MSQNNLDKIYEEFGKDICLFPFMAGFYSLVSAEPVVTPCSVVKFNNWGIKNESILESMNSDQWINLRHNFIHGSCHTTDLCKTCSLAEQNGGDSPRQLNNWYFVEHLKSDLATHIRTVIDNKYQINRVLSLDFAPSNYCNYECIMCNPGASSKRGTFEIKFMGKTIDRKFDNALTKDFYNILEHVEILNFTGGETLLQQQVHELIDYLIDKNLAKNITISLLTNVSKYPKDFEEKFKQFKNVFYTLSIDGVGDVIEYQRRGAKWKEVESNALKLLNERGCVVNYVLTAVNVFSFDKFIEWASQHSVDRILISLVFDHTKNLSVAVIPNELKNSLVKELSMAKGKYSDYYADLIDRVIDILNKNEYNPKLLDKFVKQIQIEDLASKKKLIEVVPKWKPYFEQT